jgi:hypothetical protein
MLFVDIPWVKRGWALPFFTVVAPSERYHQTHNQRHKTLLMWARQMLAQVRRWIPGRVIGLVADSSFAALEFLNALHQLPTAVSVITHLCLDAALYEPALECQAKQIGHPRKMGKRYQPQSID